MIDLRMSEQVAERFWASVDKTGASGCWEWRGGSFDKDGYGVFHVNGQNRRVHRIAFAIANGSTDIEGLVIHSCDNEKCVNPDHLRIGTHIENMVDKVKRGRCASGDFHGSRTKPASIPRGSKHGNSKITEDDVREILRLRGMGYSCKRIASFFGMDQSNVFLISKRKTWKHVDASQDFPVKVAEGDRG
jgi:hypothetical protein